MYHQHIMCFDLYFLFISVYFAIKKFATKSVLFEIDCTFLNGLLLLLSKTDYLLSIIYQSKRFKVVDVNVDAFEVVLGLWLWPHKIQSKQLAL